MTLNVSKENVAAEASSLGETKEKRKRPQCFRRMTELPAGVQLHLDPAVQGRAAELKLQHEVHLESNRSRRRERRRGRGRKTDFVVTLLLFISFFFLHFLHPIICLPQGRMKHEWAEPRQQPTFDWERSTG